MTETGKKRPVQIPSRQQVEEERNRLRYHSRFKRVLVNTFSVLVVVAAVAVLLTTLFLPVLQVTGTSMEPTLESGDVVVLVKTNDFNTGDLCAVRVSGNVLLKRMIAGPGDWIDIDQDGNVFVNGTRLDEPYLEDKALGITDLTYPYQVPESTIFVMGDNRSLSIDSRNSQVGCINNEQIIGRIILRIWPLPEVSWML